MSDGSHPNATTEEAIMNATYRALCTYGYAETSIARIAEEFPKSKSLLYYHYENKDELFADFLAYLLDKFESQLNQADASDPYARLLELIEKVAPTHMDEEKIQLFQALLEMRAQTPHNEAYRKQFERTDQLMIEELKSAIESGIERGDFADVNVEGTARVIQATLFGIVERRITIGDSATVQETKAELEQYIQTRLQITE